MKRTVAEDRAPDPLLFHATDEGVRETIEGYEEELAGDGYGEGYMYQVGVTMPPAEGMEDIDHYLDGTPCLYVMVTGAGEEGRYTHTFYPEYEVSNRETVADTVASVDAVIEERGYDLTFWQVSSVDNYADLEAAVEALDTIPAATAARTDVGMEEDVSIGWFPTAPMDRSLQFGYRAFATREQDDWDELLEEDNGVARILERLAGERDDEVNDHHLSQAEAETLLELEDAMNRHGLL